MKKMKFLFTLFIIGFFGVIAFGQTKSIDEKVDSVLSLMTLKEKIGQMNQYSSVWDVTGPAPKTGNNKKKYDDVKNGMCGSMLNVTGVKATRELQKLAVENSRLGIPMIFGQDVIHGYKTIFPVPLAEASSWDIDLIERTARVEAIEAAASGIHWTFNPMVDICRDPRWGRIMEGAGEDPYLGSLIAKAKIKGYQGESLGQTNSILACAKHFAGYGWAEGGRDYNSAEMAGYTLFNTVLPPFKASVDAGAATFMNSFNTLNGIPATGSIFLVDEILKKKWGFEGFVVSDWASITDMILHGYAKDKKQAAERAAKAKCDMDMEAEAYIEELEKLVKEGKVDENFINDAVKRILKKKFELGLFEDPYKYCDEKREKELLYHKDHMQLAYEAAQKSIVLLKNDNQILPLKTDIKTLAVIGPLADNKDAPIGNWRCKGEPNSAVSLLEGIRKVVSRKTKILHHHGCILDLNKEQKFHDPTLINESDMTGITEAVEIAKKADVVILAVGETAFMSGEARSRANIDIPGVQLELIKAIYKTGKPIVLVLSNGRPLNLSWENEHIPAIVETWLLGSRSGDAIADVLFGKYNPSGKLTVTFPVHKGQIPVYYNHLNTGRPVTSAATLFASRYTDSPNAPLYPFGYGLSYSSFEYSDIQLSTDKMSSGSTINVSVKVKNTGNFDGEETVQLYIRDLVASYSRPIKELKDYKKVLMKKGEEKTVSFTISTDALSFFDAHGELLLEPGEFDVLIGPNSRDLSKATFTYSE